MPRMTVIAILDCDIDVTPEQLESELMMWLDSVDWVIGGTVSAHAVSSEPERTDH